MTGKFGVAPLWVALVVGVSGCESGGDGSSAEGEGNNTQAASEAGAENSGESDEATEATEATEAGEGAEANSEAGADGEPGAEESGESTEEGSTEPDGGESVEEPEPWVPEFGPRDGGASAMQIRLIVPNSRLTRPTDIGFNPNRPEELWVTCFTSDEIVVAENYGTPEVKYHNFPDQTNHFAERIISIAFGDKMTFGTCGDSDNDYNGLAPPNYFMGPVMWESSIEVFYEHNWDNPGGPHTDMLHASPFCTGVAWESDNRYFAVNGILGSVESYDFREPHDYGADDHSDGIIRRLATGVFTRVPEVPSHMELDRETGWLYIADPGGARVVRVNTKSGDVGAPLFPNLDPGTTFTSMEQVNWEVFLSPEEANMITPSGVALHDGTLFVSDFGTGIIHAFDVVTGARLDEYDTLRGPNAIMGVEIGPVDGLLYFVDSAADQVLRLEPKP
jgi:hypothetical protein